MSLTRVHVNRMDLLAASSESVMKNIIPSAGDRENSVGRLDVETLNIDGGIFPCPSVDVRSELFVHFFFEVRDSPSLCVSS